ncbi:MAG TPA: hypothetical protein VFV42_01345 [Acidimicrobiales bacterium]|nr:hypothetical protein [Acidimicrobiales bacterium]
MTDDPTVPGSPPEDEAPTPLSPTPFVVALALAVVLFTVAFVFLRSDDSGELVRPDRLTSEGGTTVVATAKDVPACWRIERAQADFDDDRVFVELVAQPACDEREGARSRALVDVVAEIELPEEVGDRRLVSGVGRTRLPCTGEGSDVRCAAAP